MATGTGSVATALFLKALEDETEHLGHADLHKRMSERAQIAGIHIASSDSLNIYSSISSSVGIDQSFCHSGESPLDGSVESTPRQSRIASTHTNDNYFGETALNAIKQQLDKIEKTVMANQSEIQGLRKVCDQMMLVKSEFVQPHSRESTSGMEVNYSLGGSKTPLDSVQQPQQSCENEAKGSLSYNYELAHSTHEDTSGFTQMSSASLPHLPIGLHV